MNRYRPRQRSRFHHYGPLVAFLIIASFGILFAGCSGPAAKNAADKQAPGVDDITFTEQDLARFQKLASEGDTSIPSTTETGALAGTGTEAVTGSEDTTTLPSVTQPASQTGVPLPPPVLDLSMVQRYAAMRTGGDEGSNVYRVTNTFLNVRAEPRSGAALAGRLNQGDAVTVSEFTNAEWAKIQWGSGKTGYAVIRYLAKLVTSEQAEKERKAFDNTYYVHYSFVNVRSKPESGAQKIGQIDGQTFVRPLSVDAKWARVSFQGKEAYVSMDYLEPFRPAFIVRQDSFTLPILHYHVAQSGVLKALADHVARLKQAGVNFLTFRDLQGMLQAQENHQDTKIPPKSVMIAVTDLNADTTRKASDILYGANIPATFFFQGKSIGMDGITQKTIATLQADNFDIQSAGQTGDDLRSLTNAEIALEVAQSRKALEDATGKQIFVIDYPQGGVNDRVEQKAAEAGYLFGIGNAPEKTFLRTQFLRLPSFSISPTETADDIVKILP